MIRLFATAEAESPKLVLDKLEQQAAAFFTNLDLAWHLDGTIDVTFEVETLKRYSGLTEEKITWFAAATYVEGQADG